MKVELKEALLTLNKFGWRPLVTVGGIPTAGVCAPGGFEPYSSEERAAIEDLKTLGWSCLNESWEEAGHRASYAAPPDRSFETVFQQETTATEEEELLDSILLHALSQSVRTRVALFISKIDGDAIGREDRLGTVDEDPQFLAEAVAALSERLANVLAERISDDDGLE